MATLYAWRDRGAHIDVLLIIVCAIFATASYMKASLTIMPPVLIVFSALLIGASWRRGAVRLAVGLGLSDEATKYILANPVPFLNAALKKLVRFWSPVPNAAEF